MHGINQCPADRKDCHPCGKPNTSTSVCKVEPKDIGQRYNPPKKLPVNDAHRAKVDYVNEELQMKVKKLLLTQLIVKKNLTVSGKASSFNIVT